MPDRGAANPDEQRPIARRAPCHGGRSPSVFSLEVRILAGGAAEADAGNARLDEKVDEPVEGREIDPPSAWMV